MDGSNINRKLQCTVVHNTNNAAIALMPFKALSSVLILKLPGSTAFKP